MEIIYSAFRSLGKRHSNNLAKIIDKQEEPELFKAIMNEIDRRLNVMDNFSYTQLNPEQEMMQDMLFQGLGLGSVDNLIDVIKYGRYAFKAIKFKISQYITIYRESLISNLPPLHPTKMFIKEDFRKEEITQEEVNSMVKKVFLNA